MIYYGRCTKHNFPIHPECEYTCESKRQFKARLGEHRDYVKSEDLIKPSGIHLNKPGHAVANLKGMAIEAIVSKDPFVRKQRERYYIRKFQTLKESLNQEQ